MTVAGIELAIVATNTATLVLGSLIVLLSYRAYRRTGATALRSLALGFGVVTLGAILAGLVDLVTSFRLGYGVLLQSALTLVGFAIITYSLYAE